MKHIAYIATILMAVVVVGCGGKTDSNNAEVAEVAEVETVEAAEVAEVEIVPEAAVHGGLKLKTESHGITYTFKFYNDMTLSVNISHHGESHTYEGTWKQEGGSYHDAYYKWYTLNFNFEGSPKFAYIDENRRLFGPLDKGNLQTARAIAVADDSSDPLHNQIIEWVSNLEEVQ